MYSLFLFKILLSSVVPNYVKYELLWNQVCGKLSSPKSIIIYFVTKMRIIDRSGQVVQFHIDFLFFIQF